MRALSRWRCKVGEPLEEVAGVAGRAGCHPGSTQDRGSSARRLSFAIHMHDRMMSCLARKSTRSRSLDSDNTSQRTSSHIYLSQHCSVWVKMATASAVKKKLVVCGGNGFLGNRICKAAVAREWDVTSIR